MAGLGERGVQYRGVRGRLGCWQGVRGGAHNVVRAAATAVLLTATSEACAQWWGAETQTPKHSPTEGRSNTNTGT